MTRHSVRIPAVLCLSALLAACGAADDGKPASRKGAPKSSSTSKSAKPKKPSQSSKSGGGTVSTDLAVGVPWAWEVSADDGWAARGTTTVLGYEQPVAAGVSAEEETGQPGYVWGALEVKVCHRAGDKMFVSSMPWSLAYDDGARQQPSGTTYGDFPQPQYPTVEAAVPPGDCLRGKIVFAVPEGEEPEKAVYSTTDGLLQTWKLT